MDTFRLVYTATRFDAQTQEWEIDEDTTTDFFELMNERTVLAHVFNDKSAFDVPLEEAKAIGVKKEDVLSQITELNKLTKKVNY